MDRLTEMEAFATVVDQGGFTDAARKLGISKSAVSKHVSSLEGRLGARLLNRTTRRVSPTEIGLAYYDRARRVLNDAGEADALVTAMQAEPSGLLRVSAAADFGAGHLSPVLGRFLHQYPNITVNMVLGNRYVELISEGFDLAVRVGDLDDSSLLARKLACCHKQMVASPAYLEEYGRPTRIDDLNAHKLLHYSSQSGGNLWRVTSPTGERRQVRSQGWLTVNDGQSLLTACVNGLGIAFLPSYLYGDAMRQGLVVPAIEGLAPETLGIHAVYPPGRYTQPKVRAFVDFLVDTFRGRGPEDWPGDHAPPRADGAPQGSEVTTASTRRLSARPSGVALGASGAR
jgi:DNA-binding transcriptional LysR family regulator